MIAELIGIPEDERGRIFDLSNKLIGFDDPEFQNTMEDGKQAAAEMWLYAHKLAVERKEGTGDDLVSVLMRAEVDGEKLTELEFDNFFLLLAVAGNETTRNLLSGAMHALIEHPDQWRAPAARPLAPRHRGRGVPALGVAGDALPAHRDAATSRSAASRSRRARRS